MSHISEKPEEEDVSSSMVSNLPSNRLKFQTAMLELQNSTQNQLLNEDDFQDEHLESYVEVAFKGPKKSA